jgi:hypothetical protein
LLFTLFAWAWRKGYWAYSVFPNALDIEKLIHNLHSIPAKWDASGKTPAIGAEKNPQEPGAFVYDHEQVFDAMARLLGSPVRLCYNGKIYMPWEEARGNVSWTRPGVDLRQSDMMILQVKTAARNGHFATTFYDPYKPAPTPVDLKSVRLYSTNREP